MKREATDSATPPSSPLLTPKSEPGAHGDDDYAPSDTASPTPGAKRARSTPKTPKKRAKSTVGKYTPGNLGGVDHDGAWEPGWSPDKKEAVVATYMSAGIKAVSLTDACRKVSQDPTTMSGGRELSRNLVQPDQGAIE